MTLKINGIEPARARLAGVIDAAAFGAVGSFRYERIKRLADLVLAALIGLLSTPLIVALAAYIWVESGSPVLTSQVRLGRWGRPFRLRKFRTLPCEALKSADEDWSIEPVSPVMARIRRAGLDEIPQLLNVLRGEMSLVGPRPERPYFARRFERQFPLYSVRHQLRPGLTGWAQIGGWRGDTSIERRLERDLDYFRNWSLRMDLNILLRTAGMVVRGLGTIGASNEGRRNVPVV